MLTKRVVSAKFDQGVNTKEDAKALAPLELVLGENARRKQFSKIEKRYGSVKLGDTIIGSSDVLQNSVALAVYYDELLQFNKQSVYSYSESAQRSTNKGSAVSAKCSVSQICNNNYEQSQIDQAVARNIALLAWEDSRGGVRLSLFDREDNSSIVDDYEAHATATRPRCITFKNQLYLFYIDGNDLFARIINPLNPLPLGAEVTVSSSVNSTNIHYDIEAQSTYIAVSYNVQGASQVRTHLLSDVLAVQATANVAEVADNAISVFKGPQEKIFLFWRNTSAAKVRGIIYNLNLTVAVAAFDVDSTAGTVKNITGYSLPDDTGVRLFYEYSAAATYNHFIRTCSIDIAGSVSGAGVFMRSVGIASKAFAYSPDTIERGFITVVHDSSLQATFFVARNDGFVVGKLQAGKAGGVLLRSLPSTVSEPSEGLFTFGILAKKPVISETRNDFLSFKGVALASIDFTDLRNFSNATLGENMHIVGGIISMYDGQSIVEHGFHLYPENVSGAESTGGALTTTGTYSYRVCYEWIDAAGNLHRSAPSAPLQVVLTSSNNRITLTIPTLRITQKQSPRTDVNIVVYRTESLGSTYYRASSATSLLYNDTSIDTVDFVDDLSDANLIVREQIYTSGNILENTSAPCASLIARYGKRIVLAGTEDDSIAISKERQQGFPVEFSDFLTVPNDTGDYTTAIAEMDDKLIIFKKRSIFQMYGDGPDNSGAGGEFSIPSKIASDIGCIDSKSVAELPQGLVFKSSKGIWILSRDLQLSYIGAPVELYNDLTVTAAIVVGNENELRMTTLDGPTLVYNYVFGQWFTHTNTAANDAAVWKSQFVHIKRFPNDVPAVLVKEQKDFYQDIDKNYSLRLETGWISFVGLQHMQRLYRAVLLGEYKSPHILRVRVAFNFVEVWTDEFIWKPQEALDIGVYGDDLLFGDSSFYGGDDATYQPLMKVSCQKSQSVKFLIEDVPLDGSRESYNITGAAFEVGSKKGVWKQKEASIL